MRNYFVLIGLFIALGGAARAAESPIPEAQADELMRQALELRRQGQNGQALELLQKAEALAPSARALAQLGSAEFALQRWVDAETHLEQALSMRSPWLDLPRNRDMLERTLADTRRHIARVELRGTAGAEVAIDGKVVGLLPLAAAVHVAAGQIHLTATASGHQPLEKTVTVTGEEDATVSIDLAVSLPPAPVPPPAPALVQAHRPDEPTMPSWRRWTGAGLFVAGLAAVGTGIAWVVVDGRVTCSAPAGAVCELVYSTKTQGWIAIGAGAVAAGAGATLFLWKGKDRSASLAVGPGIAAVQGRF